MTETGRYLYAIAAGSRPAARWPDVPALGGGRLEVVRHAGLEAVVSTVDLEEYGEEGLRRNLEDLAWLEEVARAHDTVVQAAATHAPTAPLRLATICLDDAGVRERLDSWHDALEEALDRVEGRREWSVKVFARSRPAPQPAVSQPATGGAAYLQRKKAENQAREADESSAAAIADEVHERLAARSVAGRRLAPQDPRLTGRPERMLHNGAYLVELDRGRRLRGPGRRAGVGPPRGDRGVPRPVAAVLLRDAGAAVTSAVDVGASVGTTVEPAPVHGRQIALVDLLDRLLGTGVVLAGDVVISLAGVDLVQVRLHALITTIRADMVEPR